ncbi:MAG TPA: glycosyltransferase family 2 protein [Acidobacteriota bacterium]|nr:glycosyltransferase family 2 protein [Acidobacteriota bacterium]
MPQPTPDMQAPSQPPLVSAVVVNCNRRQLLMHCLHSLLKQDYPRLQIVVVDNGSDDGSVEAVHSLNDSRIEVLPQGENLGFAAANNRAMDHLAGRYVALLNNDAEARPDWISRMVEALESQPRAGMAACKILFHGSTVIDKAGHLIFPDGQNRGRGTGEPDRGQYDEAGPALFPDGCAALYRRRLLQEAEGFDADFFAYADDADLGLRARLMGWDCLYVPQAVVEHHHSSTSGRFSQRKIYWVERNRWWLAVKVLPLPLLLLSPLLTAYRWAWNLLAALLGRGSAGAFRGQSSLRLLLGAVLRAVADGARGTPAMWRKRRRLRQQRRLSDLEFLRLLLRWRISARRLAFQERQ